METYAVPEDGLDAVAEADLEAERHSLVESHAVPEAGLEHELDATVGLVEAAEPVDCAEQQHDTRRNHFFLIGR